jgi:biopolymer transport protein ExbB
MFVNSLFPHIRAGGYAFMIPLILFSVAALAVVLERFYYLSRKVRLRVELIERVKESLLADEPENARRALQDSNVLTAAIVSHALELTATEMDTPSIHEASRISAEQHLPRLAERMWLLRAIGHIAPLVGLLGTVVGLTTAFQSMADAGLSQQSVAEGISMALTTTVTGLIIAIPTLFADYFLRALGRTHHAEISSLLDHISLWYKS